MSTVDPATGTDWVPFESDTGEPALRLGRAELLTALLQQPEPAAVRTARKLGFADAEFDDAVRLIGSSALFARGLLVSDDGDRFVPVREAALIARAAATVERWISIGDVRERATLRVLGIESRDAVLLVAHEPHGVAAVSLVAGDDSTAEVVAGLLADLVARGERAFATVERPEDPEPRVLLVRRAPGTTDGFEVAVGRGRTRKPPFLPGAQSPDDLRGLVDEVLVAATGSVERPDEAERGA